MKNTDFNILILICGCAIVMAIVLFFAQRKYNNRFKDPDKFLSNIEAQLTNALEPKYFIIPELEKAIKLHPGHKGLIDKLKKVQKSEVSKTSPRIFFLVLSVAVAIMGSAQVIASVFIKMKIYSFILGMLFIVGAYFLYRQSKNSS